MQPTVLSVSTIAVDRAAHVLQRLYPHAKISVDRNANALIVVAPADDVQAMRAVLQGIDVRNPIAPTAEVLPLTNLQASTTATRLHTLFPNAQVSAAAAKSLLVRAAPQDMAQIKALVAALEVPPPVAQATPGDTATVTVMQAHPRDVARAVAGQSPHVRVSVSGSVVFLSGLPDDVAKAKALVAQLDVPLPGARTTRIYRIRTLDAASVGDLIARSFPSAHVTTDKPLNALSVTALVADQQRIGDAIAQLDNPASSTQEGPTANGAAAVPGGGSDVEVVSLRSEIPTQGTNGTAGSGTGSGVDTIVQTLQQLVP
ncbi:MAG: secretin N-terminal domain-containing protein, partial [Vulcanimicrobiaceae bacterium]